MTRLPTRGYAASTLAMYRELLDQDPDAFTEDDADLLAVLRAWDGRALTVTPENADALWRGLTELANTEDEEATRRAKYGRDRDPALARFARAACVGLSGLSTRAGRCAA